MRDQVFQTTEPAVRPQYTPFSLLNPVDRERLGSDVEDAYPLTRLQARMLFHNTYHLDDATYHDVFSYHVSTGFSRVAFQVSFGNLVEHHAVLRTFFDLVTFSEPIQIVAKDVSVPIEMNDIRHLSPGEQEAYIKARIQEERRRGFTWSEPPLLRLQIHIRTDQTFNLTISFHHAILDSWSVASLMAELFLTYKAVLDGRAMPREPPQTSFAEYVAVEKEVLASHEARHFWVERLSAAPSARIMPWPQERQRDGEYESAKPIRVMLPIDVSNGLQRVAGDASVPLKSVLLAAHLRVLSLVTGQDDVVTGVMANGRLQVADGNRVLGLFLNMLPFSMMLNRGTWLDLIAETFDAEKACWPYQRYPLAEMQRHLGVQELPFDTLFGFVSLHVYEELRNDRSPQFLQVNIIEKTNCALDMYARFELSSNRIDLILRYDEQKFSKAQIEYIGRLYGRVLEAISKEHTEPYRNLSASSDAALQNILNIANDTQMAFPNTTCIHHLFEEQVARSPESPAVIFEDDVITYEELDKRANRLADHLRYLGCGPDELVGICLERSVDMAVALLGTLKAGAAYVPVDPAYPSNRIAYILENAGVTVLLTQQRLCDYRFATVNTVVCLDRGWDVTGRHSSPVVDVQVQPDHLAYMIYTSGSTGQPKGVCVSHGALVNLVTWMAHHYRITPHDIVLFKTLYSFDASVWEFFVILLAGGQLIMAQPEGHMDVPYLIRTINAHQVTVIQVVPSILHVLLSAEDFRTCSSLRAVFVGGEALMPDLVSRFYEVLPDAQLENLYGPTEATINATWYSCPKGKKASYVPIGRPVGNTQIHILDTRCRPVPIGVAGELYIGGAGLARGYWRRPALTAERFIPNPFSDKPGQRLYRTGDLARWLPNGTIEFLGRKDHQVKLHGYRIELGEIEVVLSRCPNVDCAVVIARHDKSDTKRLIAFVVPEEGRRFDAQALRTHVAETLPHYMIPAAFIPIDALPLTPNGKIDRKVLATMNIQELTDGEVLAPPRDIIEQRLVEAWKTVFDRPFVGVDVDFFDLGGHSIMALQIMSMIQNDFGVHLHITELFQHGTIADLARYLRSQVDDLAWPSLVPIQPQGAERPFFCVSGAGGTVLYFYELARALGLEQPFYGLQMPGLDGKTKPLNRVKDLAALYVQEIRAVQPNGPYRLGGHSFGAYVASEMVRQLQAAGNAVELLAVFDAWVHVRHLDGNGMDWDDARWIYEIAKKTATLYDTCCDFTYDDLVGIGEEQQLDRLRELFLKVELLPVEASLTQTRGLLNVYRASMQAIHAYVPAPNLYTNRIVLFKAAEQDDYRGRDNGELDTILADAAWGWGRYTAAPVDIHITPGNHLSMMSMPHVKVLAERLEAYLTHRE